jgi:hypothetical protein
MWYKVALLGVAETLLACTVCSGTCLIFAIQSPIDAKLPQPSIFVMQKSPTNKRHQ